MEETILREAGMAEVMANEEIQQSLVQAMRMGNQAERDEDPLPIPRVHYPNTGGG
jgi:predicted chitinase